MQSEIGSNFWIHPNEINKEASVIKPKQFGCNGSDYVWMSTARSATSFILDRIDNRNVEKIAVIPSFTCHTVIEPFITKGYKIHTYHINRKLLADANDILEVIKSTGASVFLFHKYFGWNTITNLENIMPELKRLGVVTIEDCTQNLYSTFKRADADYFVGSIRKWCGVPDGGFAVCKVGQFEDKPQNVDKELEIAKMEASILKYKCLFEGKGEKRTFLKRYREAEDILNNQNEYYSISDLSTIIQSNLDIENLINKRRKIFEVIVDCLKEIGFFGEKLIFNTLNDNEVPLYCPILCEEREKVQSVLALNNIYAPVIWHKAECSPVVDEDADYVYDHILCIPVDQRYDSDDMERIVTVLGRII